ncbi:hypothetical protein HC928_16575 [bacterium]|nr:hypothetical protein [bacterium]
MTTISLNQFFVLYLWFPLAVLIGILVLIARFYERFSGARTYYHLLVLSAVVFGIAVVRYAEVEQITGDLVSDVLLAIGGVLLSIPSLRLYWLMVINNRANRS